MAFYPLEQLSRLHDGYQQAFEVGGHHVLLCQLEGKTFIVENRCPHMDVPLTHAVQLPGCKLRCRAHGIEFDLLSGKACGPLADLVDGVKTYILAYEGTKVGVEI